MAIFAATGGCAGQVRLTSQHFLVEEIDSKYKEQSCFFGSVQTFQRATGFLVHQSTVKLANCQHLGSEKDNFGKL